METNFIALSLAILVVAFLYSSVGHAGASGYIAVLTLFGLAPGVIKPTALVLNILVASIGTWQFWRAGYFSRRLFWPFALGSVPLAFFGGYLNLPSPWFKVLVGIVLLCSAARLCCVSPPEQAEAPPSAPVSVGLGAGIGFLSGLTGTGGGIFLTPLLLFKKWATIKTAAAVSVVFILVNSIAGLLGNLSNTKQFPSLALGLALAAGVGGWIGSSCGSRRFPATAIKHLLAIVLVIAGLKLILT